MHQERWNGGTPTRQRSAWRVHDGTHGEPHSAADPPADTPVSLSCLGEVIRAAKVVLVDDRAGKVPKDRRDSQVALEIKATEEN